MMGNELIEGEVFCCPPQTSIKEITAFLKGTCATILLIEDNRIQGIIEDYQGLIEEHSFSNSPSPIGRLLENAVHASLLVRPAEISDFQEKNWIELVTSKKKVVAWLRRPGSAISISPTTLPKAA